MYSYVVSLHFNNRWTPHRVFKRLRQARRYTRFMCGGWSWSIDRIDRNADPSMPGFGEVITVHFEEDAFEDFYEEVPLRDCVEHNSHD